MEEGRNRLADLFVREKARLLGYVRQQVAGASGADAEDMVSDVAYHLLRRADLVTGIENLTAYVYRSLANRITDHRRSAQATLSLDHPAAQDAGEPRSIRAEDAIPTPEEQYQQTQLRQRLQWAIGQLRPKERAVWVATEIDDRSFRDLAEDWDEPIGTLLSRKSRANARLRELLSDYQPLP